MEVLFGKIMETIVLPPGLQLMMLLFGGILRFWFYRTGQTFIYVAIAMLVILSMPFFSYNLMAWSQTHPALTEETLKASNAKAIVILAGGRYTSAPEYNGRDTVSIHTLERIRYGAQLHQTTKLPILVTGGLVFEKNRPSEGELMKEVLEKDYLTVTRWVEGKSRTTYENAIYSYEMLNKEGINDIIIVTQAFHMPRSVEAFEKAGFNVTAAGVGFHSPSKRPTYFQLLPSMSAFSTARTVLHEWIGRAWYHFRYYD